MTEEINDLDLLVEAFNKVLPKELNLVQSTEWLGIEDFKKKVDMFGTHKQITEKVINQADKIYKKAYASGRNSEAIIEDVIANAKLFYSVFSTKIDTYLEETDFLSAGDNTTKEIQFQSDMTKAQFTLQEKMKQIFSASTSAAINVELFNNVKIPPILKAFALKTHPDIIDYLEQKRKQ